MYYYYCYYFFIIILYPLQTIYIHSIIWYWNNKCSWALTTLTYLSYYHTVYYMHIKIHSHVCKHSYRWLANCPTIRRHECLNMNVNTLCCLYIRYALHIPKSVYNLCTTSRYVVCTYIHIYVYIVHSNYNLLAIRATTCEQWAKYTAT